MTPLPTLTLNDLTTAAGAALVVVFLTQVILGRLPAQVGSDWGTVIAIGLGVAIVLVATILTAPVTTLVLGQAVLTGLVAASIAIATHNLATGSAVGQGAASLLGVTKAPPPPPPDVTP
jgi:hypothetical protein